MSTDRTPTVGCLGCQSFHVPEGEVEEAIHDEINRGYWRSATVEQAKRITLDAREAGPCLHSCHRDSARGDAP